MQRDELRKLASQSLGIPNRAEAEKYLERKCIEAAKVGYLSVRVYDDELKKFNIQPFDCGSVVRDYAHKNNISYKFIPSKLGNGSYELEW